MLCAVMLALVAMTACKSGTQNENAPKGFLSVTDFSSNDIIVMGTYDELVAKMGEPVKYSNSIIIAKMNCDTLTHIPGIFYDGISYIRRGDSVQLHFVDFRKCGAELTLQTGGGRPMKIDSNTLCDDFYAYMDKYVFPDGDCQTLPDKEKMSFDAHYMTEGMCYALEFVSDTLDKHYVHAIAPVFTPQDKRLWYIEFSAVDMRGLYRNK